MSKKSGWYPRSTQSGFSLMELMVTLAIVVVIAGIAVPTYMEQMAKGRLSECATFAYEIASAQEQYYTRNATFAGSITDPTGLNARDTSENSYCTAELETIGGSCDPDDPSERCVGFTVSVTLNNAPDSIIECEILTLDNRGQKGVDSSTGTPGEVSDCWN